MNLGHFCSMANHSVDRQKWLDKTILITTILLALCYSCHLIMIMNENVNKERKLTDKNIVQYTVKTKW